MALCQNLLQHARDFRVELHSGAALQFVFLEYSKTSRLLCSTVLSLALMLVTN